MKAHARRGSGANVQRSNKYNFHDVLIRKERELKKLQEEIDALRRVLAMENAIKEVRREKRH